MKFFEEFIKHYTPIFMEIDGDVYYCEEICDDCVIINLCCEKFNDKLPNVKPRDAMKLKEKHAELFI